MARVTSTDVLKEARNLIANRTNWIKGKNQEGNSYCVVGAVFRATRNLSTSSSINDRALDRLKKSLSASSKKGGWITDFNDHPKTTHKQVMSLFDRAIATK